MYFKLLSESGRREKWTAKVSSEKLLACCQERIVHHTARAVYWAEEARAAERRLRSEGIKIQHHQVSGGQRMEAQLDSSMSNRVNECESNLKSHADSAKRFVAFKAMFAMSAGQEFDCNADDVLYFNLEGADPDDGDKTNVEGS